MGKDKGFDISAVAASPVATLKLMHPVTGESTGVEIDLYGRDSDVYREHERKVTNRRLSRAAKRGSIKARLTAEELETEGLEVLVVCTKAWRGMLEGSAVLECTPDNVRRIYSDIRLRWIRDQVDQFIGDREGFFAG